MERIDVFEYIDRAGAVLDENRGGFMRAAEKLTEYLESTFGDIDSMIGVTSRVKTSDSLKEKILRNSLYKSCSADKIVFEVHDIIGVRLECRFFKDEQDLYRRICEVFCVDVGDGCFSPVGKKTVKLKLDTPQPEKQRNGFDIYRIDGYVVYAGESYRFELQIKSLVNSFWSEIEHKLIYKNVTVGQTDNLMKDMLNSIHESLTGVDHQLNLIFDRISGNTIDGQFAQLEKMLSLGLNEIYTAIVKSKMGIPVSITEYSDAIVKYLFTSSSYIKHTTNTVPLKTVISNAVGMPIKNDEEDNRYSSVFINLMEWLRHVDYASIAIGEKHNLGKFSSTPIEEAIADVFLKNINDDFYLNTFFHIYFSLERGNDDEDFADYIKYYTERIMDGKTQDRMYRTLAALVEVPAQKLPLEKTIEMLAAITD